MATDSEVGKKGSAETETPVPQGESRLSRRDVGKGAAILCGLGAAGFGYLWFGSRPALALEDTDNWIANSASIISADGSVDSITFGDPDEITDSDDLENDDNRVTVSWEGFDSGTSDADFTVYLAGTDGGDGGDWAGGDETTAQEEMATGEESFEGTSGAEAFTWTEIFDSPQPVDVEDHSEIDLSDFEAVADDSTTVRELEVTIEVTVPDQDDITATESALATITVTNQEALIEIGGQGSFEITSDEEVDDEE